MLLLVQSSGNFFFMQVVSVKYKLILQRKFVLDDSAAEALETFRFRKGHFIADGTEADSFVSERGKAIDNTAHFSS